jgi:predicted DNA-binding protein (MmcQ/YjbR family)
VKNVHAKSDAALREIRAFGLAYPGAHLKSPWPDHCDLAVNDKTFAYLSIEGEPFGLSCKLPVSGAVALMLPNAQPTAYGLGKSGWVTVEYAPGEVPPLSLVKAWIDESYRAQAPKKLVAALAAPPGGSATGNQPKVKAKTTLKTKTTLRTKTTPKARPAKKRSAKRA